MHPPSDSSDAKRSNLLTTILALAIAALMAMLTRAQGRIWWCKFGDARLYVNEAWGSSHTSQHLLDPYTFTHVLHGVLFFWLTSLIFARIEIKWRFVIAILAEAAWEVFENSNFIIERYRENTASLDYFGDSIANSAGDILACGVGFAIAAKIGWQRSLLFFVLVEFALLALIRDSLLLNILMLLYPLDAVKVWQAAA